MIPIINEKIESYLTTHTSPEHDILQALSKETYANCSMAIMQVGHVEGAFLRMMVQLSKAKRVLEIGTFTGYSALAMAEGLPDDGELITCDCDAQVTQMAQDYWNKSPHGQKICLMLGPALQTIQGLDGEFDVVFIDADKEHYCDYWELCVPKVSDGGLLIIDNVLWNGDVLQPSDMLSQCIADANHRIVTDERVDVVMLPLRDGITLARKK